MISKLELKKIDDLKHLVAFMERNSIIFEDDLLNLYFKSEKSKIKKASN